MDSPETLKLLRKRIRAALVAIPFPPTPLLPLEVGAVERTIDRIAADDRLIPLFARLDDDDSLRRTFLSLYFQAVSVKR